MNTARHLWAFHELMSCFEDVAFESCEEIHVKSELSESGNWENSTPTI
jgi:hypothetical protein